MLTKTSMLLYAAGAALNVMFAATAGYAQAGAEWSSYGGDALGSQYSTLTQINTSNAANLKLAWTIKAPGSTPIFANNTLYSCVLGAGVAYDPETGVERWKADPSAPGADGKPLSPRKGGGRCRSIVYWQAKTPIKGAPCQRRIFWGDSSANFYAVDADTGRWCQDFGAAKGHPGYVTHLDYDNRGEGVTGSGTPIITGDLMVGGLYLREGSPDVADGFVRAFDVRTGDMKWEFDPIPEDQSTQVGAVNIWSTLSADTKRGLVFIGTTALNNDYYGGLRPKNDTYSNALIALNTTTGKPAWSRQLVHHDLWDFDIPNHALLATITKGGKKLDVAIQHTKQGFVFVFDRATGKDVYPVTERPVPKSTVPGEDSSPTQPTTEIEYDFGNIKREDVFGINAEEKAACLKEFDAATHGEKFSPVTVEKPHIQIPANGGGANIGSSAYDPKTNLLLLRYRNTGDYLELKRTPPGSPNKNPYFGIWRQWLSPMGIPCTPPPWNELTAIDMGTGKRVWTRPWGLLVEAKGKPVAGKEEWGSNYGARGPIVTAGGVAFLGAAEDPYFNVVDIRTGKVLWKEAQEMHVMAAPMTYMYKGKQYASVAVNGRNGETVGTIVAYSLGK